MIHEDESQYHRKIHKMLHNMKTYKQNPIQETRFRINTAKQGETIEQKINRVVNNKEPIKDGAPIIFTERKDGVKPEHDIRTDRFEIAVDATTKIQKSYSARREESAKARQNKKDNQQQTDPGEPTKSA